MLSNIPGLRPYRLERGIRISDADTGAGTETASASDLEALVIVDVASGRIALSNSAAEQLFGYSAGEAVGLPIRALLPQQDDIFRPQRRALGAAALDVSAATERNVVVPLRDKHEAVLDVALTIGAVDSETDPARFLLTRVHRLDSPAHASPRQAA